MYKKIQLPPEVLEAASEMTVADLLDSPTAQVWIISALGNVPRFHQNFETKGVTKQDAFLRFIIQSIQESIPVKLRHKAYAVTCELIRERKDQS